MVSATVEYREYDNEPIRKVVMTFEILPQIGDIIDVNDTVHRVEVRIFKPSDKPDPSAILIGCVCDK